MITFTMDGRAAAWLSVAIKDLGEKEARRGAALIVSWLATWDIGRNNPQNIGSIDPSGKSLCAIVTVARSHPDVERLVTIGNGLLTFALGVAAATRIEVLDYVRRNYRASLISYSPFKNMPGGPVVR